MDVVLKLRELRRQAGLSQKQVAARSGVGEKTLSSFETGERIGALKLTQLERVVAVYGLDLAAFFNPALDAELSDAPPPLLEQLRVILESLAPPAQRTLVATIATFAATLPRASSHPAPPRLAPPRHPYERRSHAPAAAAAPVAAR